MARTAAATPARSPRRSGGRLAVALIALLAGLALLGPWIVPFDPLAPDPSEALQPPSLRHPFGTDQLGRDVLSRVVVATRLDLGMALASVLAALAAGGAIGAAAGWCGGWVDRVAGRVIDTVMAFPLFVLAVGVAVGLGNSITTVIVATAVVNLPFYARQTRAEVGRQRGRGYVEAARLAGAGPFATVFLHIAPNILPGLMVQSSLNMAWAILNAAGLSFIGLGIRPPQPEWGIMVSEGAGSIISGEWWLFIFPGSALMLAVLAFTLAGDALRDRLDPRSR